MRPLKFGATNRRLRGDNENPFNYEISSRARLEKTIFSIVPAAEHPI